MKLEPTLEKVLSYAGSATHLTISVDLLADTETPISLYARLRGASACSFLLESAEGGETSGRYSFIGFGPTRVVRFEPGRGFIDQAGTALESAARDPLALLEELLAAYKVDPPSADAPRFLGGAVGYLAYDCVRYFEPVPVPERSKLDVPEACFMITERLVIVDHLRHRLILVDHVPLAGDRTLAYQEAAGRIREVIEWISRPHPPIEPFALGDEDFAPSPDATSSFDRTAYLAAVDRAKEAIRAGEIFQVVLSQRFEVALPLPSFEIYRALRALNPSPYMFHLAFDGWSIVGASPEVLVRLDGDEILLRPIAGTRRRGSDRAEDAALEAELLADEKELAEHRMLLDLGRNDVGRVARIGSVEVARPLHVERYSHVMHLVSDIRGRLREGANAFDVLRSCFPAGTVSGAPKLRAMELIADLEPTARGPYAGAAGYFGFCGNMDTAIAIRSMVVEPERIWFQAGAGIVHDSIAEREHEECLAKAGSSLAAIRLAGAMQSDRLPIEEMPTNPSMMALDPAMFPTIEDEPTEELTVKK